MEAINFGTMCDEREREVLENFDAIARMKDALAPTTYADRACEVENTYHAGSWSLAYAQCARMDDDVGKLAALGELVRLTRAARAEFSVITQLAIMYAVQRFG